VEDHDILGLFRVGMPAQQVVVIFAHLSVCVVVTDVVIIRDRKRSMTEPKDQRDDPQEAKTKMPSQSAGGHAGRASPVRRRTDLL
jgi:hypothetical protein